MGIQLTSIVKGRELALEELLDKTVAVDALNWLYQFLSIIRQRDGEPLIDSSGNITSHLSGIFYRSLKLQDAGIRLVYVFDGKPPALKEETIKIRREARAEAKRKWEAALEKGDTEDARKYAMRSTSITDDMITESKKLLDAMGIPWIVAPSEGEALCSQMVSNGDAYAAATQDYDALLFGCSRIVRNLTTSGKKDVFPEMLLLNNVLTELKLNQQQLILLGVLIGTDFNPGGVKGIGPKKALELVRKHHTLEELLLNIDWEFETPMKEIYDFFSNQEKVEYNIEFGSLNREKLKEILADKHDFSEDRIKNAIDKSKKDNKQKSLNKWF
jgi:flap endonuclease-1